MRELSNYEKNKWFDEYGRFNAPEYLFYGDELGEAYNAVSEITRMKDYGLSDEFVDYAEIEVLNMYYDQALIYAGQYHKYPDEFGLPSLEQVLDKFPETFNKDGWPQDDTNWQQAWDWAMAWREEHIEDWYKEVKKKQLLRELENYDGA
jgi:hypothetical protein